MLAGYVVHEEVVMPATMDDFALHPAR